MYSGTFKGVTSPVQNYVPMILADISIEPGVSTVLEIPANYNTFLYVLDGDVKIGENKAALEQDQVGWLDISANEASSDLIITAGEEGVRFVIYAGKPTGEPIISHGPFIADSSEDIARLYQEYRQGNMKHIDTVDKSQKIVL